MPAPIEAFYEENKRHRDELIKDFFVLIGGSALVLVGAGLENKGLALAGGGVAVLSAIKLGINDMRHTDAVHHLNIQRNSNQGEA